MITEGTDHAGGSVVEADVCIIGCGPAGLTVAGGLRGGGWRIVMLESGDLLPSEAASELAEIDYRGDDFLSPQPACRRQFGGMAASWSSELLDGGSGARLLPLDPIDFEARHWVPWSGWPITHAELAPYYDRAREHCGVAAFAFDAPIATERDLAPLSTPSGRLVTRLDELVAAPAFTSAPASAFGAAIDVHVISNATAAAVRTDPGRQLVLVNVRDGAGFSVAARVVVLAGGAIENARLLLNSTTGAPAGLGNEHDNVGRYFMDHPRVSLGVGELTAVPLEVSMRRYAPHLEHGQEFVGKLGLSEQTLREEHLLNGNVLVFPWERSLDEVRALRSVRRLVRSVRGRTGVRTVARSLAATARGAIPLSRMSYRQWRARGPVPISMSPPGSRWGPDNGARSFVVHFQPEQAPDRANRVTLTDRRDRFDVPLAALAWRWTTLDLDSIHRTRTIVASELEAAGVGRLEPPLPGPPPGDVGERPGSAHHHMGTTRMHDNPRHGVVDRNCRVHGTDGVYVAGPSVFTTGGYANPMLTIVALSLRLADHLRGALAAPPIAVPAPVG